MKIIILQNNDVYFAVGLNGPNPEILFDPSYFTFEMLQINPYQDKSAYGFNYNATTIPFGQWSKNIPQIKNSFNNVTDYSKYVCPKSRDFYVKSNFNSKNYEIVQLSFRKWTGDYWKSSDEINNAFKSHTVDFSIISSYFDSHDYSDPVHLYLQDLNYFYMMPSLYQEINYHVYRNEISLNDNIFFGSLWASEDIKFYSIERKYTDYGPTSTYDEYLSITISLDQKVNQYTRTVYSFFDMFGFLGGVFGLLHSITFVFLQFVAERRFYSFVISKTLASEGWVKLDEGPKNQRSSELKIIKSVSVSSVISTNKIVPGQGTGTQIDEQFNKK